MEEAESKKNHDFGLSIRGLRRMQTSRTGIAEPKNHNQVITQAVTCSIPVPPSSIAVRIKIAGVAKR